MSALPLTRDFMVTTRFAFSRGDGSVIASQMHFRADGTLSYESFYEQTWDIENGRLVFKDEEGQVTTRFDTVSVEDDRQRLQGRFLLDEDAATVHVLTELSLLSVAPPFVAFAGVNVPAAPARSPVAVLLRSHIADEKFHDLYRALTTEAAGFDVYVTFDQTNGTPDLADYRVLWHSEAECYALGLTQYMRPLLWHCGDFPFYFALRDLPRYEYYVMIEYDVQLVQGDFMARLAAALKAAPPGSIDMLGLNLCQPDPEWAWWTSTHKVYGDVWASYYPFVCLSPRAIAYLLAQRQLEASRQPVPEDVIHCESFTASALKTAGFKCHDVNDILPDAYEFAQMNLSTGGYLGQDFDFAKRIGMVHPVYTPDMFLNRLFNQVQQSLVSTQDCLQLLDSSTCAGLPAPLRQEFRERVEEWSGRPNQTA